MRHTVNLLSPPTAMPAKPSSQPLITSPLPRTKEKGLPEVLASNCFPLVSLPMYLWRSNQHMKKDHHSHITVCLPHAQTLAGFGNGAVANLDVLDD